MAGWRRSFKPAPLDPHGRRGQSAPLRIAFESVGIATLKSSDTVAQLTGVTEPPVLIGFQLGMT